MNFFLPFRTKNFAVGPLGTFDNLKKEWKELHLKNNLTSYHKYRSFFFFDSKYKHLLQFCISQIYFQKFNQLFKEIFLSNQSNLGNHGDFVVFVHFWFAFRMRKQCSQIQHQMAIAESCPSWTKNQNAFTIFPVKLKIKAQSFKIKLDSNKRQIFQHRRFCYFFWVWFFVIRHFKSPPK